MKMLQQHGGMIYVRSNGGVYIDTPGQFESDYGAPAPVLPPQFDERIYEPGKRHALSFENSVMDGGEMPWPEGDAIISMATALVSKQAARRQAEEEAKTQARREVEKAQLAVSDQKMLARMQEDEAEADEVRRQVDAAETQEEKRALIKAFNDKRIAAMKQAMTQRG